MFLFRLCTPTCTGGTRAALGALFAVVLIALPACIEPDEPGTLVPPTVDQDPNLPGLDIAVHGKQRRIHLRTFGEPDAPIVLVLPGSASDIRPYLPFQAFADDYRVVLWDLPGNGLSQRVPA